MDSLGYSIFTFGKFLIESVGPSLIFCFSSDPVDFHALLVHNPDSKSMRSLFVLRRPEAPREQPFLVSLNLDDEEGTFYFKSGQF